LALQKQGHEIVGACEIDKHARQIYSRHFPRVRVWPDATKINTEELPDFDLLCAGFPCQAFSLAGRRLGFEDTRGTLFYEIGRIADKKRPRYILLENVKGILYHDEGRTLTTIIKTFYELGYDIEWQIINSKYFVPQNRERIFIIGHLRGKPFKQVFPLTEVSGFNDTTRKEAQGERKRIRGELVGAIDANYSKKGGSRTMLKVAMKSESQGSRIYDIDGISPTLGVGHAMQKPIIAIPTLCVNRDNCRQNGRRFKIQI
jgi:DNA (cytosine-5)-methyltransferase 1